MKKLLKLSMLSLGLIASGSTFAQGACSVNYTTTNAWGSGGQQDLVITNTSAAKTSWQLCWTFNGNEVINNLWNGSYTTSGKNVCVKNASYNGNLPANGTVAFGFTHTNAPGAKPTSFTLNGVACGGTASSSVPGSSSIPTTSSSRSSSSVHTTSTSRSSSSASNVAARWLLNNTKSVLNFVSVKNTDVAETFTFGQLQGTVSSSGQATMSIPLASILTGIDIRNTRMQSMLFESNYLPSLHFTTQLDLAAIEAMAAGSTSTLSLSGNLILHGVIKPLSFDALVIKHANNSVSFSPRKPIVINATDFDMNAGIELLRVTAGATTIGEKVPVYFKMFLTKDNPTNLPAISLATVPNTPLNLVGNVNRGSGDATLNWADTSSNETGFLVRRKGVDGRWTTKANLGANFSTYVDNLLNTGGGFTYKIISYAGSIPSLPSNEVILGLNGIDSSASSQSSVRSSVSSSVITSSSSQGYIGDAARGKTHWENAEIGCKFCHAVNPDGTAGSSLSKIDPKNLRFATVATLPAYIATNMPKGNVGACVGQCAADTAAYFLSLMPVVVSSSSSSSSVRSSSSAMVTSSSRSSSSVAVLDGAQLFSAHGCAGCHGARGENPDRPIVLDRWTRTTLITKIDTSMPFGNPAACDTACATALADYILTWKPVVSCDSGEDVLPRRLRLLTNREYANTVNDLLGVTNGTAIATSFEPDSKVKGFDNNAEAAKINNGRLDAYWTAAKDLATNANLTSLLNCQASTPRDQCASTFVPAFGKRAFRRPLASAEQTSYSNLFRLGSSNEAGARLVIQAMLSSSNFLYRSEIGSTLSGTGSLTAYETASLLSYTFTGSMPDATLFTEADNNRLTTAVQLRTQAERLLATAKAGSQLSHFGMQWLHADDVSALDRSLIPQFNPTVGTAMKNELDAFLKEVFLKPGYKMSHVFNPGFTFLNAPLATYYGITGVSGDQFQKVTTTAQRGGVLHMGVINTNMATPTGSHPIHRGLLVRRNLLCQDFAPPPPNVGEVEPLNPNKPTRERFAAHTSNPNCQSCHQYIDNIGFGFENYDAAGRYRTLEGNNLVIDASGSISGLAVMTESDSYSFNDLRGLSEVLATSGLESTSKCVTKQYQRFATGISEPNECAVTSSYSRWQAKSTDLRDMMLETVTSPTFLTRK
jgi:polyisoprenoid-binding protein YceI/cytochrome c551/c552